ncbi:MAG TPA: DinB family protein [Planctomycetota bacterium]|nr:DinB family protein [Planctomycetota bacterium]
MSGPAKSPVRSTAANLVGVVERCVSLLTAIAEPEAGKRPAPGKWSKKEILGHLIDSACNNQQKFVRMLASSGHLEFVGYAQDAWVAVQHYQQAKWLDLVRLWHAYNLHLAHVIASADPTRLGNAVTIDGAGPFRLDFVMADYVEHLKHHLKVVLPDAGLSSNFENVYGP